MWFSDYLFSNALTTWEEKFAQGMWILDVLSLGQKRFVLAAKTGFCWRARHPPATLSQ
jgi:hypothetical protein